MNYTRHELENLGFASIGEDVAIHRSAVFFNSAGIHLGSRVRIDCFCLISAGADGIWIGNNIHISASAHIFGSGGRVVMEDFSSLSGRGMLYTASDDFTGEAMTNPTVPIEFRNVRCGPITLRRHALVGAGSIVLPDIVLGIGSSVGSLSLVKHDIPDYDVVAGIPARKIGQRNSRILELEKAYVETLGAKAE